MKSRQKEVFRVQILRPADIFLTFPWGYIGVLGLYGTRATSALTSIRQNLIFFSLKGRYGQKGEIRIPWIILLQLLLLYSPSHGSTEDCLGSLELGWSWDQPQQDKTWLFLTLKDLCGQKSEIRIPWITVITQKIVALSFSTLVFFTFVSDCLE